MNYELAKQLNDAGFPFRTNMNGPTIFADIGIEPTLSELIEACGNGIFNLLRQSEWHKHQTGFAWQATLANVNDIRELTTTEVARVLIDAYGNTPEEAVANLFLALKKK
jgi:hypothetical protein